LKEKMEKTEEDEGERKEQGQRVIVEMGGSPTPLYTALFPRLPRR
jgi:hypothetical protein